MLRDADSMFADSVNPTEPELRRWAAVDAYWPEQDWDLILSVGESLPLLMELVSDDERCTDGARRTFLSVLYVASGDAVRTTGHTTSFDELARLIALARSFSSGPLTRWADRTEELIADPSHFDDARWCDGGLAREEFPL